MKKQVSYKIVSLVFGILVVCFLVVFYVLSWTEPSEAPPGGNVPAPINVGSDPQTKTGNLGVSGLFRAWGTATGDNDGLTVVSGNVGIGTTNPSAGTGGQLKLDAEGPVGATKYCDQDGNNCKTTLAPFGGCEVLYPFDSNDITPNNIGVPINVPDYCKNGNICAVILQRYNDQSELDGMKGGIYSQVSNGLWFAFGSAFSNENKSNGDVTDSFIVEFATGNIKLKDDKTGIETSADQWSYIDDGSSYAGKLVTCEIAFD